MGGNQSPYKYQPSMAAAVIFTVVFFLSLIHHGFLLIRRRTWYFIPFAIGCVFEAIGFIARAVSSSSYPNDPNNAYIIQAIVLLLGPTLFAASIYMILGRLIVLLDAQAHALIPARWVTKVFVLGDVLSFLVQGIGGGMLSSAKTPDARQNGNHVIIVGLVVQIIFFSLFVVVASVFYRRVRLMPTPRSSSIRTPWRGLVYVLFVASTLILIRSVYRVIEYAEGSDGTIQSNEWFLYVLDALPMILVAMLFSVFHPSRVINKESMVDGKNLPLDLESRMPGYEQIQAENEGVIRRS